LLPAQAVSFAIVFDLWWSPFWAQCPHSQYRPLSLNSTLSVRRQTAHSFLPSPLAALLSMSSRFKNLVSGSRRKSNLNNPTASTLQQPSPPAPSTQSVSSAGTTAPSNPSSSTTSLPQGQQQTTPMNNQQPLGRPPSYTYANPQMGQPQHGARPHSPMPPPINTSTQPAGYPPQQVYGAQPPAPPNYPPNPSGYGNYGQPAPAPAAYNRPGGVAAEVDGTGRGKAQLIVGIDFVRSCSMALRSKDALTSSGYHILRRCFRLCDEQ